MIEGHDYTIYTNGPSGRSRMYALLALITAFLTPFTQHTGLIVVRKVFGDEGELAETALFFGGFTALVLFGLFLNVFNACLWKTGLGRLMFAFSGMPAPPHLTGDYTGRVTTHTAGEQSNTQEAACRMRVGQTWEQIGVQIESTPSPGGEPMRLHSDMASIQVGILADTVNLHCTYTFEETLTRRHGIGAMARQITGMMTLRFSRAEQGWSVAGHFYDDDGRSGQLQLQQALQNSPPKPTTP